MKKTMLTYKTLDRFEAEYKTEHYTKAQIEAIEMAAYIANMNQSAHRDWTEADIFADFLRVLDIDHIKTAPMRTAAEPEKAAEAPEAPAAVPMFPNLCEALSEEADRRRAENRFFIENGFFPSWAKEHQTDPERGLKQYSTPKKWEAYQAGTLSREKAVEIAVKRGEKEIDKCGTKSSLPSSEPPPGLSLSVSCLSRLNGQKIAPGAQIPPPRLEPLTEFFPVMLPAVVMTRKAQPLPKL